MNPQQQPQSQPQQFQPSEYSKTNMESAINTINNLDIGIQDENYDPYQSAMTNDEILKSISTIFQTGGFQDSDMIVRTSDDIFSELDETISDTSELATRETRSLKVIENQGDFIAIQAALTDTPLIDFYLGTETEVSLQQKSQEQIEREQQAERERLAQEEQERQQREKLEQERLAREEQQRLAQEEQERQRQLEEEQRLVQEKLRQQREQREPSQILQPNANAPVQHQPQPILSEEIIPTPPPQPAPAPVPTPTPTPTLIAEEEIQIPQPQSTPVPTPIVEEEIPIPKPQPQPVPAPIIEEEIPIPQPQPTPTPIIEEEIPIPQPQPTPTSEEASTPRMKSDQPGLLENVEEEEDLSDFEIDNEVDSSVYDLTELETNRLDTSLI